MIREIALAIEMGADAGDIGWTIHPRPTLIDGTGLAAEVAHGRCTVLPQASKSGARARERWQSLKGKKPGPGGSGFLLACV